LLHPDEGFVDSGLLGRIAITGKVIEASNGGGAVKFQITRRKSPALRSYVRTWTAEFARRGIRANVISPGPIETPILDGQFPTKEAAHALREGFKERVPLGRIGFPEEVASAALFLASNESSYISERH
jgi:NAD(P)-dependent dehydrogenase (short-subunit alcohol dehydrogenase family)